MSLSAGAAGRGYAWAILAAYFVLLAVHSRKRARDEDEDFHLASRRLSGPLLGLSFFATYVSTNTFVGLAGRSYDAGLGWMLVGAVLAAFSIFAWVAVAPRARVRAARASAVTVPEFLAALHGDDRRVRRAAALVTVVGEGAYCVAVLLGSGLAASILLGVPRAPAIVAIALTVAIYARHGGFRAVVETDVTQGLLMLVATVALFVALLVEAGGWVGVVEKLRALPGTTDDGRPLGTTLAGIEGPEPVSFVLGIGLAGGLKLLVDPRQAVRFYALPDERATRSGGVVAVLTLVASYAMLLPVGAMARAAGLPRPEGGTDAIVPTLLADGALVGRFTGALFLAGALAAAMSSLDSSLLVLAGTIDRNLLPPDRRGRGSARCRVLLFVLAIAAAGGAIVAAGDVVSITAFAGALFGAAFVPATLVPLFGGRERPASALASIVVGVATAVAWKGVAALRPELGAIHESLPGLATSFAAYALVRRGRPTPT